MDIALLVQTANEWSRQVLMGVAQFSEDVGGWRFDLPTPKKSGEVVPRRSWHGDGVICRLTSDRLEARLLELGKPCVNVSWLGEHTSRIPKVVSSEPGCARMATEFFLRRQYRNFGYVGFSQSLGYSDEIQRTITGILEDEGCELHVYPFREDSAVSPDPDVKRLGVWLDSLPKPTALICWSSKVGLAATIACEQRSISIPQSISIVCIEDDPLYSSLAPVPLSNVDQDPWRVGYQAAGLLHSMIEGKPGPAAPVQVPPLSVVERQSTRSAAVTDPVLQRSLAFVYENAQTGISVLDIVRHVEVSRRALETKFRKELKTTPSAFIKRLQLEAAARLLWSTKLTVREIAERSGFEYAEVLSRSFKATYGVTPIQYRTADYRTAGKRG